MVTNEDIKTALVAKLKSLTTLTSRLASADEVREVQYQGTTFGYPNVRVRVISNVPIGGESCYHDVQVGIQVNSENSSSKEAEEISGIIVLGLNNKAFSQSGVNCIMRVTNIVPALRVDERTWRSEVLFDSVMS